MNNSTGYKNGFLTWWLIKYIGFILSPLSFPVSLIGTNNTFFSLNSIYRLPFIVVLWSKRNNIWNVKVVLGRIEYSKNESISGVKLLNSLSFIELVFSLLLFDINGSIFTWYKSLFIFLITKFSSKLGFFILNRTWWGLHISFSILSLSGFVVVIISLIEDEPLSYISVFLLI